MVKQIEIQLPAFERGFHLITETILYKLPVLPETGLLNLFIRHTSAGLTINENADSSVTKDLERIFNKLVPDGQSDYIHSLEGPDDMPAHVKSSLVGHSITIPITNHQLNVGIWQGIFLCEFRNLGGKRKLMATIYS
jgi:secondary thiamine-phosphate synthase enzyme